MTLYELYVDLLRTRDLRRAPELAGALRSSRPLEAYLLDRFARQGTGSLTVDEGRWRGTTAWVGPQLPQTVQAGQLWLDTAELMVMISVAREPPGADWHPDAVKEWTPIIGWLSLHPVAVWQYRAFLTVGSPSRPPETHGILRDEAETAPVTQLTALEAFAFSDWMGKRLAARSLWQAAHTTMKPDEFNQLWGTSTKEWCGYPDDDDDEAVAISRRTLYAIPREEWDADEPPPPDLRMVYSCRDRSPEISFRTAVHDVGLLKNEAGTVRYQR